MKFEDALIHLRAGRKIKRSSWHNKNYYLKNYDCSECERDFKDEVLADDWELFEEPEKYYQDGIEMTTIHNEQELKERVKQLEISMKYLQEPKDCHLSLNVKKLEEKISEKYAHPDVIGRIERLEILGDTINAHQKGAENFVKKVSDDLESRIDDIQKRINKIEEEKYYQDGIELPTKDNQPNIETRLAELEQWTRAEEDRVNDILKLINKRLMTIENIIFQNYKKDLENVLKRIDALEMFVFQPGKEWLRPNRII